MQSDARLGPVRFGGGTAWVRRLRASFGFAAGWALGLAHLPAAETDHSLYSTGVRGGISSGQSAHPLWQAEAFVNRDVNYHVALTEHWDVHPRVELTSGALYRKSEYGYVGTLGPTAVFQCDTLPLVFDVGSRATLLAQHTFGDLNLGMPFQFTTHVGISWEFASWNVGYRFQHMSNAGLAQPNPGLNIHLLSVVCRF